MIRPKREAPTEYNRRLARAILAERAAELMARKDIERSKLLRRLARERCGQLFLFTPAEERAMKMAIAAATDFMQTYGRGSGPATANAALIRGWKPTDNNKQREK